MLAFGQAIRAPQRLLHIKSRANPWGTRIMLYSRQERPLVRLDLGILAAAAPGDCSTRAAAACTAPSPSAGCLGGSWARCAAQKLLSRSTLHLLALEGGTGAQQAAREPRQLLQRWNLVQRCSAATPRQC